MRKHEERKCVRTHSASVVLWEISYVSLGDCFAAMQIVCYVRGWRGIVGSHEVA